MYGTVKLRSKNGNEKSTGYVPRPRSWGEFQTKLTPFHRVSAPGSKNETTVDANTVHDSAKQVTPESKQQPQFLTAPAPSKKTRPLSESTVFTPFYKPFRPFGQRNSSNQEPQVFHPNLPAAPPISPPAKHANSYDDVDASSLAFEEALRLKPDEPAAPGISDTLECDEQADDSAIASLSDTVFIEQAKNAEPAPEGTLLKSEATASRLSDSAYECASEGSESNLNVSSGVGEEFAGVKSNEDTSSDVSSIVDTGFYSVDEKENSPRSHKFDLDLPNSETEDMADGKAPAAAPRKSRAAAIPKSLRSCYNNTFAIDLAQPNGSTSSIDYTDEESNASEAIKRVQIDVVNTNQVPNTARQITVLPITAQRSPGEQQGNRVSTSSESSFKSESEASSQPPAKKGILRKPKREQEQTQQNGNPPTRNHKELGWKDDQIVDIGYTGYKGADKGNGVSMHGTWPRRQQKSRKKQDQEEAEELLRRFRETSETYRNRFKGVFAETRRKMEEVVFGLRVSMAKNGYSARCYQPKYNMAAVSRDAKA